MVGNIDICCHDRRFGYLNGRNIIAFNGPLTAAIVGGVSMVILLRSPKKRAGLRSTRWVLPC